jgi:ATP synthase protein I
MTDEAPGGAPRPDARSRQSRSTGAEFAGLGLQLGMSIALFAFLGWWLDERLGTSPWLLLLLVFLGAAAGFYSIYRRVFPGSPPGGDRDAGPGGGPTGRPGGRA